MNMELSSKKLLLRTVLLPAVFCYASCPAQTLRGLVVDEQERSVMGVTVLVQGLGTEKTRYAISDRDGKFFFSNAPRPYRLIVQHLAFETYVTVDSVSYKTIVLRESSKSISEVVVTAPERAMRVNSDGGFLYDARTISKNHPSANALQLLDGIPLVQKTGDEFTVAGASSAVIMINGRRSNLTQEQLKDRQSNNQTLTAYGGSITNGNYRQKFFKASS